MSSAPDVSDCGAPVNEWVNVIRRARLGPTVKLVALTIASYADPDGSHVFPGVARVAVQCEIDYRTARRGLATLRERGLIEVVKRGARRSGKSDEYRLILASNLLERCDVPTPAAERLAIERTADRERNRRTPITSTGLPGPVESAADEPYYRSPAPCNNGSTGHAPDVLQVTPTPPPSIDGYQINQPPPDDADRRYTRTGNAHAREADDDKSDHRGEATRPLAERLAKYIARPPEQADAAAAVS